MKPPRRINVEPFEMIANITVSWKNGYTTIKGRTTPEMLDKDVVMWYSKWEESNKGFFTFCQENKLNSTAFWNGLGKLNLRRP